jgi:hypothetical protein
MQNEPEWITVTGSRGRLRYCIGVGELPVGFWGHVRLAWAVAAFLLGRGRRRPLMPPPSVPRAGTRLFSDH